MKKIFIFGLTASGKTTLAKKISRILKIPVYSIDDIVYKIKWSKKYSEKEREHKLNQILKNKKWIMEGVHSLEWIKPAIKKAEIVIFLNPKKITMAKRALKRAKLETSKGNKIRLAEKTKLLYWVFRWGTKTYKMHKNNSQKFIELKTNEEINKFLEELK